MPTLSIDNTMFGLLTSIGSYIAVITTIIGGVLADQLNFPIVMVGVQVFTVVGMALQATGAAVRSVGLVLAGRLLFMYVCVLPHMSSFKLIFVLFFYCNQGGK